MALRLPQIPDGFWLQVCNLQHVNKIWWLHTWFNFHFHQSEFHPFSGSLHIFVAVFHSLIRPIHTTTLNPTAWYDFLHLCIAFSPYSSCPHCSGLPLYDRQTLKQKHNIALLWRCGIFSIAVLHYYFAKKMVYSYEILWKICWWLNNKKLVKYVIAVITDVGK